MALVHFHATLLVLLISIMTASTCLSAYLVSRKKLMLCACVGFTFYFFDTALIFQDEYIQLVTEGHLGLIYMIIRSLLNVVTGGGFLLALWAAILEYLGEENRELTIIPLILFVVACVIALFITPTSGVQRFTFYTIRQVFLLWILGYASMRLLKPINEIQKTRLKKQRALLLVSFILIALIIIEDAVSFIILADLPTTEGWLGFFMERNYSEELLMVLCAIFAIKYACRDLSLRYQKPPSASEESQERLIQENLMLYARQKKLSARESEVLTLVLSGKDNQNIASSFQLSPSTVKVHIHNILKKTGCANRTELLQDFWKMS